MYITLILSVVSVILLVFSFLDIEYHDVTVANPDYDKIKADTWLSNFKYNCSQAYYPSYTQQFVTKREFKRIIFDFDAGKFSFVFGMFFLVVSLFMWIAIWGTRVIFIDTDYQIIAMEREILVERLSRIENEDNYGDYIINGDIGSLESVYIDIKNFNTSLIRNKRWVNNKWIGWFYNPRVSELELIDVGRR